MRKKRAQNAGGGDEEHDYLQDQNGKMGGLLAPRKPRDHGEATPRKAPARTAMPTEGSMPPAHPHPVGASVALTYCASVHLRYCGKWGKGTSGASTSNTYRTGN